VEASALFEAFGRTRETPLVAGSLKTNIGHLEGASGVTALVKTVLMLEREQLLPNSGFTEPNVRIPLAKWKLEVILMKAPHSLAGVVGAS
jgi:acyl transferase domain-containing protein